MVYTTNKIVPKYNNYNPMLVRSNKKKNDIKPIMKTKVLLYFVL